MYNARKIEKKHFTVFPRFEAFISESSENNEAEKKITQTRYPEFQMR